VVPSGERWERVLDKQKAMTFRPTLAFTQAGVPYFDVGGPTYSVPIFLESIFIDRRCLA